MSEETGFFVTEQEYEQFLRWRDKAERAERTIEVLDDMQRAERARGDHMSKLLSSILMCLPPEPVKANGSTYVFKDPTPETTLRVLQNAIRDAINRHRDFPASSSE